MHVGHAANRPPTHVVSTSLDRWTALVATTACLALGWRFRRAVGSAERGLFADFNHRTEGHLAFRTVQQLGTPWLLPLLSLAGFVTRRPQLAVAAALALPAEKASEVGIKKVMARPRPAQVDRESEQHDDAPTEGPSYPSGHAAIAFAGAGLVAPFLSPMAGAAAYVLAAAAASVRVRQGAHFPGDAVGGALLGVAVATTLRSLLWREP